MPAAAFVQAVFGMLGAAQGVLGPGAAATTAGPGPSTSPPAVPQTNTGQAAAAFLDESHVLTRHVGTLDIHDQQAHGQFIDAAAEAQARRDQMSTVIGGAIADANRLLALASHPEGVIALVNAMGDRLQQTLDVLTGAQTDSTRRTTESARTASAYNAIPGATVGPTAMTSPMAELAAMQATSMMAAAPMSASAAPLSALGQMGSFMPQMEDAGLWRRTSMAQPHSPEPTTINGISYDRGGSAKGSQAYREYIAQALDVEGVTDPTARYNWTSGLMVGASRESSFDPGAVNTTDSNATGTDAADGFPANCSRGVLQTVPGTFKTFHQPGTSDNIYDPVANTAAAMNYLMKKYHVQPDGSNLSSVGQFNPNHAPGGY